MADLLGTSPGIAAIRQKVRQLLQRQADARRLPPVLIQGETGTGKGLLARALHQASPRQAGPFVDINCAAIPDTLLEAEMFGFERGAFTDARQAKAGLFQTAHRGTIFLDEIGLLPEPLQAKLLKVLEEHTVRRLGATRSEPVDVWILAATSENLALAAREPRFREDLYHRLAVLTLWLPPLRERGPDILLLAEHFLARACADYRLPPKEFAATARAALLAYPWPGNIRELSNAIERVALLSEGSVVTAEVLALPEAPGVEQADVPKEEKTIPLEDAVGSVERSHLLDALTQTNWNVSQAAARLGISRNTLRYRIEKHGLRPGARPPAQRRRLAVPPTPEPKAPVSTKSEVPPPPSLRWEQRRLTLLRADLVSPREERLSLESSRQLQAFVEKVQSFGGRVEEIGLTGLVGAFGLEPVEDAPRRAVLAALAIQKAVEHAQRAGESFAAKIGIHVGQFLVGYADGGAKIDLDAKRHAWMVLEALVVKAEPNAIVVCQGAIPFLERRFDLVPLGILEPLVGKAYRLVGRERAGLGPGGRMAKFVGRDHELGLLQNRLHSAARGQGQIVGIAGEAGIGKSRLLYEFRQGLKEERAAYLEGRCLSYGTTIPYLPVLDILRGACEITEADGPDTVAEKVRSTLEAVGLDPQERAPYLLHLFGITEETDRLAALGPEAIKARTFETLTQLHLRASRQNPLVIAVEDLHWIDKTSEEYFTALAEALAGTRILLVSTYRFGYRPAWIEKSYAAQISLQPLASEESVNIVRSVLGTDQVADSVLDVLLSKAEGNPFFLEELAWTVREQEGLPPTLVPDTIEEVIRARIGRLPPEEKTLLQSASVIGKDVPFVLLKAVADLPDEALDRGLAHLQAAEFLHELSPGPDTEYTFKHALTQEVAYGSLLEDQRRALHARIVEAIERHYPDRLAEQIERLATHAFRGEVWEKAPHYLCQAGAKAFARSANREAVACFEQGLAALKHLPESRQTIEQAIDLRFDLRNPLQLLGEFGRILEHLREAKTLAEALDEPSRLGWAHSFMTQCFRLIGDLDQALESGQRALEVASALGDTALQVATDLHLGPIHAALGDYRQAIAILRRSLEHVTGDRVYDRFRLAGLPSVGLRTNLLLCLAELGEFAEGIALSEEAIRLAEAADDPYSLIFAYFGAGTLHLLKGELSRATPILERGIGLCQAVNLPLMFPPVASSLGFTYALSGRTAEGIALLERAVEQATSMRLMNRYSSFLAQLGEGYLLAGRLDDARHVAEQALQVSRKQKERGHEAYGLRLLGEIASHGDSPNIEEAEASYRQALRIAEDLGMHPLLARCHLGLGRLYQSTGRRTTAPSHVAAATALLRELDMPFWLERETGILRS